MIMQAPNLINKYIICDGTNNPDMPSTKPYAVIYKASLKSVQRGSEELSEHNNFFDGLAYYSGKGKWIDHNNGFPAGLIDSESPDAPYSEYAEPAEINEFKDSSSEKDGYIVKFRYTVFAYFPLPDYPDDIKVILAGGDEETEKLVQQFES